MVEFLDGVSLEKLVLEQRERLAACEQAPRVHVLRDRRLAGTSAADVVTH
jgi:hypothetical protein